MFVIIDNLNEIFSFQGNFVAPTVITKLEDSCDVMQEEIFGPVTVVVPFDNFSEVSEIIKKAMHFCKIQKCESFDFDSELV